MFRLRDYRFGIARFLLGLYVAVLINGIAFRHAHRLADGTIICHAHPYKSTPGTQFPKHGHSQDELIWLDAFSNLLYAHDAIKVWTAIAALVLLLIAGSAVPAQVFFTLTHIAFRHRGPPVHLV